jgi:peptidoglycan hydrolase-like protein with peptidoglycan-binding domain
MCGIAMALMVALAMAALPATAAAQTEPKAQPSTAALLVFGAGYGQPQGSGHVRRLQRRLRLAGESPGPIDGRFGPLTDAAVRRFQLRRGLAVDGIAGPKTRAALERATARLAVGAGYTGARGSARVRSLRRQLRRVGENPGPIDGRFGPRTEAAVVRFQRDERLAADGIVGDQTRGALEQRLAKKESKVKSTREPTKAPAGNPRPTALPSSGPGLSSKAVLAILAGIAMLTGVLALAAANRPTRRRPMDTTRRSRRAEPFPFGLRAPSTDGASAGSPVLGYATVAQSAPHRNGPDLREQEDAVAAECERRGLVLLEFVHEREPANGKSLERPGLGYALDRISAGEATGLVVADVSRLSHSVSEFGPVLDWFSRSDARLVAVAQGLDTAERDGRLAAQTLIEVSRLAPRAAG